ncbi:MAG: ATP-binding cassette domain-containing protein, partial [Pseudomonadota bacterium]
MASQAPVVQTKDLTIRFGGNVAVNAVNLTVEPFTLKAIIGPNGAGKTTLFNLLSGQYKPTSGSILFKGRE